MPRDADTLRLLASMTAYRKLCEALLAGMSPNPRDGVAQAALAQALAKVQRPTLMTGRPASTLDRTAQAMAAAELAQAADALGRAHCAAPDQR